MFQRDDGFSLVEVVIAMFLFWVLSLAVLPLLIGVTLRSVENRELLSATAYANERIATIQASYPSTPGTATTSCATLRGLGAALPTTDAASGFTSTVTVGGCPSTFPASIPVVVTVKKGLTTITSVATRVRVGAA